MYCQIGSQEQKLGLVTMEEGLSIRAQCRLLGVHRSNFYYDSQGESALNIELMRIMSKHAYVHPGEGVRSMVWMLSRRGYVVNPKRVGRLLRIMRHRTVYPRRNLSTPGAAQYKRPYLLKGLDIRYSNQVWCTDITYVPMEQGFMYLIAIMDVYSRKIMGWDVSNTIGTKECVMVLEGAVARNGTPEILNSDQGSQFTSGLWLKSVEDNGIAVSMDGKGRALDNVWIERFWRTVKYLCTHLNPSSNGEELHQKLTHYITYYNDQKVHHTLRMTPGEKYTASIEGVQRARSNGLKIETTLDTELPGGAPIELDNECEKDRYIT